MQGLFIDSVKRSFANRAILSSVYLKCGIGEVVGLLGRNGSGKSTLLKIIFGSVKADFKYLNIDNRIYDRGYLSKNLCYLPQDNFIPNKLSVAAAIELFCKIYREKLLEVPFVADNFKKKFRDFSGGERRLLEALIIIYSDADFVLLDEPFSQLAPLLVDELKHHINSLKPFKGFVITDHDYRTILNVSDRIVLLHNGCNYTINSTNDLMLYGYLPNLNK
ncbi:ATP-binding cassette domain-containing protein [Pedobacter sp. UBA5917]|jgi:ABC-type multidrug transport system ATPase subunit|uniref:ATP-binding cassette domain-containing protein n=1 Tax=Pedobacter sp. UBA5917 TaxID=1947061 RepID=UPI0025E8939D|nr:ATP-binding cassette domain-containing protein [Pedobacter sp. UBA5917]